MKKFDIYSLDFDDLFNPAYSLMINSVKAKKLFEELKNKSKKIKYFTKKPHAYNENDNSEVGFFINNYYVSFMMFNEDEFLIRIHVANIDKDIYSKDKEGYMNRLNICLSDFENKLNLAN